MALSLAIALGAALAPAGLVWWRGRDLRRRPDDAAIAERLDALSVTALLASGMAVIAIMAATGRRDLFVLFVGVETLGVLAAWFPTRRAVLRERWAFLAYLRHTATVTIAHAGPHLALVVLPLVIPAGGLRQWIAAAIAAMVVIAWDWFALPLALFLHRATPITETALLEAFHAVADRSRVRFPRVVRVGSPDACWPLTIAWPDPARPAVLVSETLLRALTPDELAALLGRDIAFIERHPKRAVLRATWARAAVTLLGCFGLKVLAPSFEGVAGVSVLLMWPCVVLGCFLIALRSLMSDELARDRRAIELCGDAETLARAIEKQNDLAKRPRRQLAAAEGHAFAAPSLARRLQAIREAGTDGPYRVATAKPRAPEQPLVLASATAGTWLVFDRDRLHWFEGVSADTVPEVDALRDAARTTHSHVYGDLSSLRVGVTREAAALEIALVRGPVASIALAETDVATVQARLDRTDQKLARAREAGSPVRLWALAAAFAALLSPGGPALVAALLAVGACLRPTASLFSAAAGAAVAQCTWQVTLWWITASPTPPNPTAGIAGGGARAGGGVGAPPGRGEPPGSRRAVVITAVALVTLLTVTMFPTFAIGSLGTLGGLDFVIWGYAFAMLGGLAGLVAGVLGRRAPWLAILPAVAPVAAIVAVAVYVRPDVFGQARRARVASAWNVPFAVSVEISPGGQLIAVSEHDEEQHEVMTLYRDGRPGGRFHTRELEFVDDQTVLVLESPASGARLSTFPVPSGHRGEATWTVALPDTAVFDLLVDGDRWQLLSTAGGTPKYLSGYIGKGEIDLSPDAPLAASARPPLCIHQLLRPFCVDGRRVDLSRKTVRDSELFVVPETSGASIVDIATTERRAAVLIMDRPHMRVLLVDLPR
jgi:heat shock protein HtpX